MNGLAGLGQALANLLQDGGIGGASGAGRHNGDAVGTCGDGADSLPVSHGIDSFLGGAVAGDGEGVGGFGLQALGDFGGHHVGAADRERQILRPGVQQWRDKRQQHEQQNGAQTQDEAGELEILLADRGVFGGVGSVGDYLGAGGRGCDGHGMVSFNVLKLSLVEHFVPLYLEHNAPYSKMQA